MTLESILDTDKDIEKQIDDSIEEMRATIRRWVVDNLWIGNPSDFRRAVYDDFEVDDQLCISFDKRRVTDITFSMIRDIPEYIHLKYVGKAIKFRDCGTKKGDISFLFKYMDKSSRGMLSEVWIHNCNFKSIGDWSDRDMWMFVVTDNKNLKMRASQLPRCNITLEYKGNGNEFKLSDVKNKMLSEWTIVRLDRESMNAKDTEHLKFESILDDDEKVKDDIRDRDYYLVRMIRYMMEVYKNKLDFKHTVLDDRGDYVYIPLTKKTSEDMTDYLSKLAKRQIPIDSAFREYTSIFNKPLIDKLIKEGIVLKSQTENCVVSSDYAFSTFKVGDIKDMDNLDKRLFPSVGIVINKTDFTDPVKSYCVDLGDDKLHEKMFKYIKELAK